MKNSRLTRIAAALASLLTSLALGQSAYASTSSQHVHASRADILQSTSASVGQAASVGQQNAVVGTNYDAAAAPANASAANAAKAGSGKNRDNPFDSLYKSNFTLKPLSDDQIAPATEPPAAQDVAGAARIDPAYGTRTYRITDAADGQGGHVRHEDSRRQAFNADNSRYIARDAAGAWYLYDGKTFKVLKKLDPLAGDCEPIWHASNPDLIHFTSQGGGATWWTLNVSTGSKQVLFDFAGKTAWPEATSFWTGGQGTTSADGRFISLMATSNGQSPQGGTVHGLVTLDLKEKKIVASLDAKDFPKPGATPEVVSTSPSGKYVVASWPEGQGGTRAYTRTFSKSTRLAKGSERADLAFGPDHQDYYVYADYLAGKIVAVDLDTQKRISLRTLSPAEGETYSLHISGQSFDKPGWVVISTYGDSADDGATSPSPTVRPEYRKVWLLKLQPGGRALNVTHVHTGQPQEGSDPAVLEPRASASRDLSRIVFASDFGKGEVESFMVGLPTKFDK